MTPLERLEQHSMKGKQVVFKNKGLPGARVRGVVEDEVYEMVSDYKHMVQRIRFDPGQSWDESEYAYRVCYYTLAADARTIKFGQYPSFLSQSEFLRLLTQARQRGWGL